MIQRTRLGGNDSVGATRHFETCPEQRKKLSNQTGSLWPVAALSRDSPGEACPSCQHALTQVRLRHISPHIPRPGPLNRTESLSKASMLKSFIPGFFL